MPEPRSPQDPKGSAEELAKIAALSALANAEAGLFKRIWAKFQAWAARLHGALFATRTHAYRPPDPLGVFATSPWWADQVTADILPAVELVWRDGYAGLPKAPDVIPDSQWGVKAAVASARNRLVGVPDAVFAHIRAATMKATTEGWSAPDLAIRVEEILGQHGQQTWRNRALTVARTEALTAYNTGKFASMLTYAKSFPDTGFDKIWLATHDHRTRFTHTRKGGGDLQRVPLHEPFRLGEEKAPMMFPGDPAGPAHETINCRCSLLLVEAGEEVDLSDRHYRSAA